LKIFFLASLFAASSFAAEFTGVITDTMCGEKHGMMGNIPDDQCIKECVKGSDQYALWDGHQMLKLSDQKLPVKFAAKKVKVTGTLDEKTKTIKVSSIAPANN
jgi:hypothetical protein